MIRPVSDRRSFEALRHVASIRQGAVAVRFVALRKQNQPPSATAVAFALSRRVGSAVVRNRIRRRLRAVLRDLAKAGNLPKGVMLISATRAAAQRGFPELRADLSAAISRASKRASAAPGAQPG